MRRQAMALAGICVLLAGCGDTISSAEAPTPTATVIPRPLVERELAGLLLDPAAIGAAVNAPMIVSQTDTAMSDDGATMAPPECLALDGAAEAPAYADSGFRAARDASLADGNDFHHYAKQAVVLFPYLEKAADYIAFATHQWQACDHFVHLQTETHWSVGPVKATADTLDTVVTQDDSGAPGWACGRSLVQRNNVVIDVNTCGVDPGDSAMVVAKQIADKVDAAW
jgi:hypothetical protein